MNITLSPSLDTSEGKSPHTYRVLKRIKTALYSLQLMDTWRIFFPKDMDFTFYSNPHDKYTQLDYIFVLQKDRPRLTHAEISIGSFSDLLGAQTRSSTMEAGSRNVN